MRTMQKFACKTIIPSKNYGVLKIAIRKLLGVKSLNRDIPQVHFFRNQFKIKA